MAGDFVMVQFATARKIEVHRIAAALGIPRAHAFGLCVEAWIWFDEQTEDGVAKGATAEMLDAIVGAPGFTQALSAVGWIRVRESSLELPNFDRLMGKSAKKRVNDADRQRRRREDTPDASPEMEGGCDEKRPCDTVTKMSQTKRDESVTKEEKRREDINTTHTHAREEPASPLRTWPYPRNATEGIYPALDRWQAYQADKFGRPAGEVALEALVKLARNNKWDDAKIDSAVTFSIAKGARSWLDPDCDFQSAAQASASRIKPKVDASKVKF